MMDRAHWIRWHRRKVIPWWVCVWIFEWEHISQEHNHFPWVHKCTIISSNNSSQQWTFESTLPLYVNMHTLHTHLFNVLSLSFPHFDLSFDSHKISIVRYVSKCAGWFNNNRISRKREKYLYSLIQNGCYRNMQICYWNSRRTFWKWWRTLIRGYFFGFHCYCSMKTTKGFRLEKVVRWWLEMAKSDTITRVNLAPISKTIFSLKDNRNCRFKIEDEQNRSSDSEV